MDDYLRHSARRAEVGDYFDRVRWKIALLRGGLPDPDISYLTAPLSYEEEIELHYDDVWWHAYRRYRLRWDCAPRASLVKAHHPWGHRRGWAGENSKRKTLRTHRNGSRRRVRIDRTVGGSVSLSRFDHHDEVAARRRRRFGGREHRGGLVVEWTSDGWPIRVVHVVNLDR